MSTSTPESLRPLREASEWLVRLRAEPDSEEALTGWLRWCEADPANAAAFERIQLLWRQMDQVSDVADLSAGRAPHRLLWWRAAAAIVAAVIAADIWHQTSVRAPEATLAVSAPADRQASLPDGTSVHLAAKTSLTVDFGGPERRLRMSSGEAYFRVHPDKKRPFVVRAGSLDVTAVGTAFDVKDTGGRISVTVQEGVVAVAAAELPRSGPLGGAWRVGPGYQFQYSEQDGTAGLSSVDTSTVLAWREGRLEYVNAPLSQVLADVNRYAQDPIDIDEATAGQLTFTGTVFTNSIGGWLDGLPGALPVRVVRTSAGHPQIQITGERPAP